MIFMDCNIPKNERVYSFGGRIDAVREYEKRLDEYFYNRGIEIYAVSAGSGLDKSGVDRIFKQDGREWKIQYKVDLLAQKTGNGCIELISRDDIGAIGWGFTTQADYYIYYVADIGPAYLIDCKIIKQTITTWGKRKYPVKPTFNQKYNTWNMLVPLDEFEKIATAVYPI